MPGYFAVLTIVLTLGIVMIRVWLMRRIPMEKYLFSALTTLLLASCARELFSNDVSITQQESMELAVEIASLSIPEISGSQVAPSNIHADKSTLEEAVDRINANRQNVLSDQSPDRQVWLVTMDGIWLPPNAPDLPMPEPYRHFSIILDAETGDEMLRSMQP